MVTNDNVYLVGVDGGGSKTKAVVADARGHRLGQGTAAGSNYVRSGIGEAVANIKRAVDDALAEAGLTEGDIAGVQYALASADRQEDFEILIPALAALPFRSFEVVCDTLGGLRTGSHDGTGAVVICGFGTNAAGRDGRGKLHQVGGFGSFFGDYAGGNWLARQTFQAAIRSWEGREEPSLLTVAVPKAHGFEDVQTMVDHYLNNGIDRVPPELTIIVHEAAMKGDRVAIRLLENMGRELGLAASAVLHRLEPQGVEEVPVVLIGSVLQKGRSPHLLAKLKQIVMDDHPNARIRLPEVEPVIGSVLLAMDRLRLPVDDSVYRNLGMKEGMGNNDD
ncbi:N-acetylglucosamine kinase [Cohnella sp. GCM10027633]|uniref:N-acetylglucosamine kinase n=1 Tax=unclassified Cohnella TaxID=2636738 RepID=UPI0036359E9B